MTGSFRGWRLPVVAAVVAVAATGCSSSSSSSGGTTTPDATIVVQNFRYNGVPATLPSGIVTL
jgi:outer membrane lipoprotein SlyB